LFTVFVWTRYPVVGVIALVEWASGFKIPMNY